MNSTAAHTQRQAAPMVITVPPELATKLRNRLADLEMPESNLELNTLEFLAALLEDDGVLLGGWCYDDIQQAERVARRVFKREGCNRLELAFGDPENPVTKEFLRTDRPHMRRAVG